MKEKQEKYANCNKQELAKAIAKLEVQQNINSTRIAHLDSWRKEMCIRVYGIEKAKSVHPKELLKKICIVGMCMEESHVDEILNNKIRRLRKIENKTVLLVEVDSIDTKLALYKNKKNLGKFQNPFGNKQISITDDLTTEHQQILHQTKELVQSLKDKFPNEKVAVVKFDRLVIGRAFLNYKEAAKLLDGRATLQDVNNKFKTVTIQENGEEPME